MAGKRRGLLAPQNMFLENVIRRATTASSIDSATMGFYVANARIYEFPIVYCSDEFCTITGYNRTEHMHKTAVLKHMHSELTDQGAVKRIIESMENGRYAHSELFLFMKNKQPLWLLLHVSPIVDDTDKPVLILVTIRDITSIKIPFDDDDGKALGRFVKLARTVNKNKHILNTAIPSEQQAGEEASAGNKAVGSAVSISMGHSPNETDLPKYQSLSPKIPKYIILHTSLYKQIWDWGLFLLTIYTAIIAPFMMAYRQCNQLTESIALLSIDIIVDITFIIDVFLNFRTTYADQNGEIKTNSRLIIREYLSSWFIVDIISSIPFGFVDLHEQISQLQTGSASAATQSDVIQALRISKLVRMLRLVRVIRKIDDYTEQIGGQLIVFLCFYLIVSHWLTLIWVHIGYSQYDGGVPWGWLSLLRNTTMVNLYNEKCDLLKPDACNIPLETVGATYVSGLYFTLSIMTTVGFGNIAAETTEEKIFTCFLMFIGALMYAVIFGSITTMYQEFQASSNRYHDMLTSIRDFIKLHQVPKDLGERVLDYFVSSWSVSKGVDADKVMNYCPKDMRADLSVHLYRNVLKEHPAFRLASDGCLRALAGSFNLRHNAPGDLVVHTGESIDHLYFVISGSLEVIQDDEVVAILTKGDTFGDNFWKERTIGQACANVRAMTYCGLHIIMRDDLLSVLQFYTAFAHSFARNITLTYNLRQRVRFKTIVDHRKELLDVANQQGQPKSNIPMGHPVRKIFNRFRQLPNDEESVASDNHAVLDANSDNNKTTPSSESKRSNSQELEKPLVTVFTKSRNVKNPVTRQTRRPLDSTQNVKLTKGKINKGYVDDPQTEIVVVEKTDSKDSGFQTSPNSSTQSYMSNDTSNKATVAKLLKLRTELKCDIRLLGSKLELLDEHLSTILGNLELPEANNSTNQSSETTTTTDSSTKPKSLLRSILDNPTNSATPPNEKVNKTTNSNSLESKSKLNISDKLMKTGIADHSKAKEPTPVEISNQSNRRQTSIDETKDTGASGGSHDEITALIMDELAHQDFY